MRRNTLFAKVVTLMMVGGLAACGGAQTPEGPLQIDPGFVRATNTGAEVSAGYLSLEALEGDRLLAARSDISEVVEIHTMTMQEGTMRMRKLDALDLPAGEQVTLAPGGDHLMFIGLTSDLSSMNEVDVTLTFENAGEMTVTLPVGNGS